MEIHKIIKGYNMKKNNKAHIYYLLLGIGIGLVLGSIINFVSPNVEYKEYTEEEIREKARGLGMYELDEIFEMNDRFNQGSNTNVENQSLTSEDNDVNEENENKTEEKNETKDKKVAESEEYIEFRIKEGESSKTVINNLFEANIIEDKEKFTDLIYEKKMARKIQYGLFKIPVGADYNTVIEILTR